MGSVAVRTYMCARFSVCVRYGVSRRGTQHKTRQKRKNGFSTACSYGYPAAVAITGSLLSFAGLNVYLSLFVATAVAIAALAPICVNVKKRAGELFLGLEAEN